MTIAEFTRLDTLKYTSSELYQMALSIKEPQVVITKGEESAILLPWKDEYQPLVESHPRPLGTALSDIKEEGALAMMALQISLSDEQDAFMLLDNEGKEKLAVVGLERYGKFIGDDFPELSDEQYEKMVELWSQFSFKNPSEKIVSELQMQSLGFAIMVVKLTLWGGKVNGIELWEQAVYKALDTLDEDLSGEEIQSLSKACHDFKLNWELYKDRDPLAVALKYQIRNIFDTEDEDKMNTLTAEFRPEVEEFIAKVEEILG